MLKHTLDFNQWLNSASYYKHIKFTRTLSSVFFSFKLLRYQLSLISLTIVRINRTGAIGENFYHDSLICGCEVPHVQETNIRPKIFTLVSGARKFSSSNI